MMIPIPNSEQEVKRVEKVWGREHWITNTKYYCLKLLALTPGMSSSLHYHRRKRETFWVLSGECDIQIGKRKSGIRHMIPGSFITIEPGLIHRFFNKPDSTGEVCLIAEASTFHDDDDVLRLEPSGPYAKTPKP